MTKLPWASPPALALLYIVVLQVSAVGSDASYSTGSSSLLNLNCAHTAQSC